MFKGRGKMKHEVDYEQEEKKELRNLKPQAPNSK